MIITRNSVTAIFSKKKNTRFGNVFLKMSIYNVTIYA